MSSFTVVRTWLSEEPDGNHVLDTFRQTFKAEDEEKVLEQISQGYERNQITVDHEYGFEATLEHGNVMHVNVIVSDTQCPECGAPQSKRNMLWCPTCQKADARKIRGFDPVARWQRLGRVS